MPQSKGKLFFFQLLKIVGLTLIIWGIFFTLSQIDVTAGIVHEMINYIIVYSALVALIVALFNLLIMIREGNQITMILGSTVLRMFLSIVIMTLLLLSGAGDRLILVVDFFLVYLFYLVFEIYSIIANLRRISKKDISL